MARREIDAGVHLLDRQVVDPDDRDVGKVDDLELTVPEDGGAPYVTAILCGPAAMAPRLGGLLARWILAVHNRLDPSGEPARIGFGVVDEVGSLVRISRHRDGLDANVIEEWCRENVVAKIPGADHASE